MQNYQCKQKLVLIRKIIFYTPLYYAQKNGTSSQYVRAITSGNRLAKIIADQKTTENIRY